MSEVYFFTCKSCGKEYKRHSYQVYQGDPNRCVRCNRETPFDGQDRDEVIIKK